MQFAASLFSGIFNSDDDKEERGASSSDENDEILAELKKKQSELRALSHQNAIMLRHLHKQAKDELQRQQLKKKMAAADAEVGILGVVFTARRLAKRGICRRRVSVCVSVCVCLSHSGIVSKWLNVGSHKQRRTIAP